MDHTDLGTLRRLPANTPIVVQTGNGDLVRRFRRVTELVWGQETEIHPLDLYVITDIIRSCPTTFKPSSSEEALPPGNGRGAA